MSDQPAAPDVCYVTIGNSDDKLAQHEWAMFCRSVDQTVRDLATSVYGTFYTEPASYWQSACWSAEIPEAQMPLLRARLAALAKGYRQDSIALVIGPVSMIEPAERAAIDRADEVEGTPVPAPADRPAAVPPVKPTVEAADG